MRKGILLLSSTMLIAAGPSLEPDSTEYPGEYKVAPYERSNANADADPLSGRSTFEAFNGKAGISRIIEDMFDHLHSDPRTEDIFRAADKKRLRRTVKEQLCYILNGPCDYTGRNMKDAHKNQGIQRADFMIMVDHLMDAMDREGVPFSAQKKLLAKLAPMHRDVVER